MIWIDFIYTKKRSSRKLYVLDTNKASKNKDINKDRMDLKFREIYKQQYISKA